MIVRTRIAPSPTGAPHIGTAYIALFNYAFAKKHGGQFLLRIEDTDQIRSTRESEQAILESLRWLGIPWDEGPDVGGPCGPYRQSERTEIYRRHADDLIAAGAAYPCFCTAERLDDLRRRQLADKLAPGYDGLCSDLDPAEAARRRAAGEPCVIRMRVPRTGDCVMHDRLRGEIRIPWASVDQQILLKTDGFPTYHLANVVDDHLMNITHVIRGEEWISSTPKHVLLYQHFGWTAPEFTHLPLLRNPDKSKLSKRKNPTSILYYRNTGMLPEAMRNYLGLLAYSFEDGREMFTMDDWVSGFNLDRVSLGGPIFDIQKLVHFNGRYLRQMSAPELKDRLKAWMLNDTTWDRVVPLAQSRINKLSDFVPMTAFLFADRLEYDPKTLVTPAVPAETVGKLLLLAQWELERLRTWNKSALQQAFENLAARENLKMRDLMVPFFVAVTGSPTSIPMFDSMEILGRDLLRRRLQYALEALETMGAGISGKAQKLIEKYYESTYGGKAC